MEYHFSENQLKSFIDNIHKEWVITNGIGGYAGSSIIGAHNRTHQGYLIASLHPPVERYLVFSKVNEQIAQSQAIYDLTTAQHAGEFLCADSLPQKLQPEYVSRGKNTEAVTRQPLISNGNQYLFDFCYDGTVRFTYHAGDLILEKSLALTHGENTAALSYHIANRGEAAVLTLTPLMNYREHSSGSTPESLQFTCQTAANFFTLIPQANPDIVITLAFSDGKLVPRTDCYDENVQLQTEVDNEVDGLDCHYTPYDIRVTIPAHSNIELSLICMVNSKTDAVAIPSDYADRLIRCQKKYISNYLSAANFTDDFANQLALASQQFLSYRSSTGLTTILAGLPWFTDWGRDTMIAFTGLTLATHHYQEAAEILETFAQYVKPGMGLVPNMFPDDGQEPLYNTADGSLWYFYAVDQYLRYVNTPEADCFIKEKVYPSLKEILNAYRNGTLFSIYMAEDGLIHAGSGVDQVTWMDVRVGDWVPTPRHGKPVEINALWYNALRVSENLANRYGEPENAAMYGQLAEQTKNSFCRAFWYHEGGYLYDVVGNGTASDHGIVYTDCDVSLRPNQIYAVSLPYTMLTAEQERSIVNLVEKTLFAGTGLRSLAPSDAAYHPLYLGALSKRDAAYHQGTSWAYLLGGFYTAYMKVHGYTKEAAQRAYAMLAPVRRHLEKEGCIGSISEIFDGEYPHSCRGCYAQAWSVGEILRCYTQDILPLL